MPKKILLADDSITIQKVVELTFSDGDYEVTAVNNGAKAVQKLTEMRPDIILSDIIMPEKNGYEVCEFVKSHPEYRNIPVILLTGTFEPFDPDRADKAGCDAVVTKPFESQSLIHKVEELIEQARSNAPTAPSVAVIEPLPPPATSSAPPPSPWAEEPAAPQSSFGSVPPPADDIFGASPSAEQFSGETRAFPKMNFDELPKDTSTQQVPAQPAPPAASPWDEQPPAFSGETRAFPRMNFEEMQRPSQPAAPSSPAPSESDSPFGASPPAEQFSGETRAFPKMNFDDLSAPASQPVPPPPPAAPLQESAPPPWDEQPPAYSGETRAFPKMSFDELPDPGLPRAGTPSPAPSSPASPWDEPATPAAEPSWSSAPEPIPTTEEIPFGGAPPSEPVVPEEPAWASATQPAPSAAPVSASQPSSGNGVELTDEQVDRIARRVVQMMSDQVVRNIAWEVIPDLAEMVVKERIRQLEAE